MNTKRPSYFTTFKTCCKNGKSPWQCVQNIAKNQGCTEVSIWNKLCTAKLAFCKKMNGKNCYFPVHMGRSNSKCWTTSAYNSCWWAIECCLQHRWCTPEQIYSWTPNQICWFAGHCMSKHYKKPANFNPNKKVKGFPVAWTTTTGTTTGKKKTTTGSKTKKRKVTTKVKKRVTTKAKKRVTTRGKKRSVKPAKTYKFSSRKYRTRKAA